MKSVLWDKIDLKLFNPETGKKERITTKGIHKDGLLISRGATHAIMVEKQGIRRHLLYRLKNLKEKGAVDNIETVFNLATLEPFTFFNYKGVEVVLMQPVIGAPAAECVVQEAYSLGAEYFVRIGTTGSLSTNIPLYSFIATVGAIRHDGTSNHYLPEGFPAVPNFDLLSLIIEELDSQKLPITQGISYTTNTRFREDVEALLKMSRQLGILNIEMESAAIFAVAQALGISAASISMVTDCLASEHDRDFVEGTLVGVPDYKSYIEKGLNHLTKAFDATLEAFLNTSTSKLRYKKLLNSISAARRAAFRHQ